MNSKDIATEIKTIQKISNSTEVKAICDVLLTLNGQISDKKIGFNEKT